MVETGWWATVKRAIVFFAGLIILVTEVMHDDVRWGVIVLALILMGLTTFDQIKSLIDSGSEVRVGSAPPEGAAPDAGSTPHGGAA